MIGELHINKTVNKKKKSYHTLHVILTYLNWNSVLHFSHLNPMKCFELKKSCMAM